jgi:hypothetical protein
MMGRQARASVRVMRLWKPHHPGCLCLHFTMQHYVTNETDSQNAGALGDSDRGCPLGTAVDPSMGHANGTMVIGSRQGDRRCGEGTALVAA